MKNLEMYAVPKGKLHLLNAKDYLAVKYLCGIRTKTKDKRFPISRQYQVANLLRTNRICKTCLRGADVADIRIRSWCIVVKGGGDERKFQWFEPTM